MAIAPKVLKYLDEKNTPFETVAHPLSYSSRETADAAHIYEDHLAKAVLLKDESGFLLAVVPASEWLGLNGLNDELNRNLQLASEDEIATVFDDCKPGAVPPLGAAYDVETVIDESLASLAWVYFEAGDHENLIKVKGEDFHELVKGLRRGYFGEQE
ncbi:MAG: aminoacyl-tRNA deacylase [Gammaproteobacteria bacterium]